MRTQNKKLEKTGVEEKKTEVKKNKPFNYILLHDFIPTKKYNVYYSFPVVVDDENVTSTKKNWLDLLFFLNVKESGILNVTDDNNDSYAYFLKKEGQIKTIGKITEFKHLIGFLVNRGPIILDDYLIIGIDSEKQIFNTTKGNKSFSVIEKNLKDNYAISATIY